MSVSLRLAWRQTRGQWRRAALLVFCVALGVGARVAVGSLIAQLDRALAREARTILTADLEISQREPFSERQWAEARSALPPSTRAQDVTSFTTMAAAPQTGSTRLVELRAVEPEYPYYGRMRVEGPGIDAEAPLDAFRQDENLAFVQPELLPQLGIDVGGIIRLGRADFRVAGVIRQEAGLGGGAFSLGPRVLIAQARVGATGLTESGSRVYYSKLIALPDPALADPAADALRKMWGLPIPRGRGMFGEALGPRSTQVRTFRDRQQQIRRSFERVGDYLRLVSLVALLLGGIGVGSVARSFVIEHWEDAAVLRTLGARGSRIAQIFLAQVAGLALAGGALGAALGVAAQAVFPYFLAKLVPVEMGFALDWPSIGWGVALGLATSVCFSILPLAEVAQVEPVRVFRGDIKERPGRALSWIALALAGGLFWGLAVMESRSLVLGSMFIGAIAGGAVLIAGFARLVLPRIARMIPARWPFALRHGAANLTRPGLRPYSAVVSLGLSALLLGFMAIYQHSLLRELDPGTRPEQLPNLFIIDVQDDQVDALAAAFQSAGAKDHRLSPMVRARYRKLNGQAVRPERAVTREAQSEQNMRSREQNLSFRERLGSDETIVAGKWMDPSSGEVEASLEEFFAERLGAKVGDVLTFDVQGVPLEAKVTSLRRVRWASFQPNFFVLITPGALAGAPKTWVGSVSGLSESARFDLQREIVKRFPNLTIFDVAEGGKRLVSILERIYWAVRFVAMFSLASGLVVLAGIAIATARQRQADVVLLKVLGAGRATLAGSVAGEFFLWGAVSVAAGFALATGFGWGVLRWYLDMEFSFPGAQLALASAGLVALCVAVGVAFCRRALAARPLELLREG